MADDARSDERDQQGRRFPGYGECIYCGSDGGEDGLRDEHIVPLALNGDAIIKNASCVRCERIINRADTHLGRTVFWHFRLHTGADTRNPKERPSEISAEFQIGDSKMAKSFPIKEAPFSLALPLWGEPGFIRKVPIDAPFPDVYFNIYHWMPDDIAGKLGLQEDAEFKIWSTGRVSAELFARSIAKIAYCHLVTKYGLHGFRRLALPDIILGRSAAVPYFVGTPLALPHPPNKRGEMHSIVITDANSTTGNLRLSIVHVRLFANSAHGQHGMPIYRVIAGAPTTAQPA